MLFLKYNAFAFLQNKLGFIPRKEKYEKMLLSIFTTFVAVFLAACGGNSDSGASNSLERIKQDGVVRIGVFGDKPPFGYVDEKGVNQGYDIVLAKRIAKNS